MFVGVVEAEFVLIFLDRLGCRRNRSGVVEIEAHAEIQAFWEKVDIGTAAVRDRILPRLIDPAA